MIIAPTIFSLINEKEDISYVLELNEEKEKKGKEESKIDIEIELLNDISNSSILFKKLQKSIKIRYIAKNYTSSYLKITTPPPEFI